MNPDCRKPLFLSSLFSLIILLFAGPDVLAQQLDDMSTADLYRMIAQFDQSGNHAKAGEAYRLIAERDLAEIENLDRAIQNYIAAQKQFARAGDSVRMFQTIADLGRLYCGSEYYLEAIGLFERVLEFAKSRNDTLLQARMLQQIGEVYVARKDIDQAVEYLQRASRLNLDLQDTLLHDINRLTISAITGSRIRSIGLPDSMILDLTEYESVRYKSFLPSLHLHVGMYNQHVGKHQLALYYFREGLKLAGSNIFVKRELYRALSNGYEKIDDYQSALEVMKDYSRFSDSLSEVTRTEMFQESFLRYQDIQRQTEFQELATERNITMFKSRLQRVINYALLVGVVIMLIVSYITIRSYQDRLNANQIITKQNEEINHQKIKDLENNLKIETMSSMLEGQEVERERIARDLHDSLGGLLSTVKLHFDALQAKSPAITQQKEYTKAYNLLDAACNEVRTISNNMQPGALLKMGIVPAIKDLINRIESEETPHIEFIHYGELTSLPTEVILHLYRIIQELLYNSLKHAKAKEILIQLIRNEEDIEIMVEDDGVGYQPGQVRKGMGTENVAARVNYLKGEISIHSEGSVGTSTSITIPLLLPFAYTEEAPPSSSESDSSV